MNTTETTPRATFTEALTAAYRELFTTPEYAMNAARNTPEGAAVKMTAGLMDGTANHDGDGIRRACKTVGIKPTRKAIRAYLAGEVAR